MQDANNHGPARSLQPFWRDCLLPVGVFIVVLAKLVLDNWRYLHSGLLPYGDAAADTLLVERARHGLLLTGHYNFLGVNHPGPFFLSLRYLSELLIGRFFDGTMAPHLIAGMVAGAGFLAVAATATYGLAGRGRTGLVAAVLTVAAVILQQSGRSGLVSLFMPSIVVVPFLALMASALATMRGSALALPACTLSAAALVHAYIPLVPIAVAVWTVAAIAGHRSRQRVGEPGFPRAAVVAAAGVLMVFAAPLLLDMALNPPGNAMRILRMAMQGGVPPHAVRRPLPLYLAAGLLRLRPLLWLAIGAGAVIALRSRREGPLWRDTALLSALVVGLTAAEFLASPLNFKYYSGFFLVALPLTGVLTAAVTIAPHLVFRPTRWPAAVMAGSAVLLLILPILPERDTTEANARIKALADAIADATPSGTTVAFAAGPSPKPALIAAAMLQLERRGRFACFLDAAQSYYYTRERICDSAALAEAPRFAIVFPPRCGTTAAPPADPPRGWRHRLATALLLTPPDLTGGPPALSPCVPAPNMAGNRLVTRFPLADGRSITVWQLAAPAG